MPPGESLELARLFDGDDLTAVAQAGASGMLQPTIQLFDGGGTELIADLNSGGATSATVPYPVVETATYALRVTGNGGLHMPYEIRADVNNRPMDGES